MSNSREIASANLALLIVDLNSATTPPAKQAAINALDTFSQNTSFANLGLRANAASAAANAASREAAIKGMSDALNGVSDLQKSFKTAQDIANAGENNLLFPRIASTLGQVEIMLTMLKEQFDAVDQQVNALKGGVDLQKLKSLAASVQNAADALKQKLAPL